MLGKPAGGVNVMVAPVKAAPLVADKLVKFTAPLAAATVVPPPSVQDPPTVAVTVPTVLVAALPNSSANANAGGVTSVPPSPDGATGWVERTICTAGPGAIFCDTVSWVKPAASITILTVPAV